MNTSEQLRNAVAEKEASKRMPKQLTGKRTAILVGKRLDPQLREQVASGERAAVDYLELADTLGAELLDFASVERSPSRLVQWVNRRYNPYLALAVLTTLRRKEFDQIYVSGEDVGMPLALLGMLARDLRFSVTIHNGGTSKRRRVLRLLGSRVYNRVFCLCTAQWKLLTEEIGLPQAKVKLLSYYCDHRFFRPLNLPVRDYVLSLGIEQRDYHTLQQAAVELPYTFRVVASGWSPDTHYGAARGIESKSNIVVERNISSGSLKELYAAARFIVVPLHHTLYAAGITTITEAMAMGKAVIVSDAPGVLDYVKDGVSGLVVPVGDAQALAAAITRLWENPELAERMGAHNRRWIEEAFTIEQFVGSLIDAMHPRPELRLAEA